MNKRGENTVFLLLSILLITTNLIAQRVVFFNDFEKGPGSPVEKIKRYPMVPEIVSSDPTYPAAFPPPSGKFAARAQDKAREYHGLGSVVGGPVIDLNDPAQQYAAIEAKIYLVQNPPDTSEVSNYALIALEDFGETEKYYRFGYARQSIYFHFFNSSNFTESLFDPELGSQLQIPGWHTFTMRFNGPNKVHFYVDNQEVFYSPVEQSDITRFRLGVLGWDRYSFRPTIADDLKVMLYDSPPRERAGKSPMEDLLNLRKIPPSATQQITWYTDPNQAINASQTSGKKFLVFFYLPNHSKTRTMEQGPLSDPLTQAMISQLIPIKLDGTKYKDITKRYNVYKYPSLIVIDMQGRIYWEYKGVISADDLNRSLARF